MRAVLGILAGLAGVIATMMLVSFIGGQLLGDVPGVNTSDMDAIKATYGALGTDAQILIVVSWFLGVLAGAAIAKSIIGRPWAAWTIAGLFEAYLLLTVVMLPMPGWMKLAALLAPLIAGLLANHLVKNRVEATVERETLADEQI